MLLYGNVPSAAFVCFCNLVFTKSKGKLKKLAKKPAIAEAVMVCKRQSAVEPRPREEVSLRTHQSMSESSTPVQNPSV